MTKLGIVEDVTIVQADAPATRKAGHVVTMEGEVPVALDGVRPVVSVTVADAERDAPRLLKAAEQWLPYSDLPGIVVLDEGGAVRGVAPREALEEAVLQMRRGAQKALAGSLGLRSDYKVPAGDSARPFIYWECSECGHKRIPTTGHEDDPPPTCRAPSHDPTQMERRVDDGL
jgi:hypothetical protein